MASRPLKLAICCVLLWDHRPLYVVDSTVCCWQCSFGGVCCLEYAGLEVYVFGHANIECLGMWIYVECHCKLACECCLAC